MTMIDDVVQWLHSPDYPRSIEPATIRDYAHHIHAFADWLTTEIGGSWEPEAITAYRMTTYLHYTQTVLHRAPATQMKIIATFRAFGHWLVASGVINDNPAKNLHAQPEQPRPPRALSRRIIQRMVDAAHHTGNRRDALILELLVNSGMRASEIAGIQIEDLERGARTTWVKITGKGAKVRRVPLPKHIGGLIDQYLADRHAHSPVPLRGALLVGQRGGITRTTINDTVQMLAHRANLTADERASVTPHAFRHTVATRLVRQRDIVTAADMLGHRDINTTRRYAKASAIELEQAVESLWDD